MFRAKNKQSFFALHQIQSKIHNIKPNCDVEFHILWDNKQETNDTDISHWEQKINSGLFNIVSYTRDFFIDYASNAYNIPAEDLKQKGERFVPLYHLLMPHYLRRVLLLDYYLIYDDDILINYDFKDVVECLLEHRPVLITEPYNSNCDKVMFSKLFNLYGEDFYRIYNQKNPNSYGFNAGFQGIDLSMYDDFLSKDRFIAFLDLFDFSGVFDDDGNEIWGDKRFIIDTQQQSFYGLMNVVFSRNDLYILDPLTCYVAPTFGSHPILGTISEDDGYNGWGTCLKSKISHFIGHTQGKGKPKEFLEKVDEYLKNNNLL